MSDSQRNDKREKSAEEAVDAAAQRRYIVRDLRERVDADLHLIVVVADLASHHADVLMSHDAATDRHPLITADTSGIDMGLIKKVQLFKTQKGEFLCRLTGADGMPPLQAQYVSAGQWQRMWLATDKEGYKSLLAAKLFDDVLREQTALRAEQVQSSLTQQQSKPSEAVVPISHAGYEEMSVVLNGQTYAWRDLNGDGDIDGNEIRVERVVLSTDQRFITITGADPASGEALSATVAAAELYDRIHDLHPSCSLCAADLAGEKTAPRTGLTAVMAKEHPGYFASTQQPAILTPYAAELKVLNKSGHGNAIVFIEHDTSYRAYGDYAARAQAIKPEMKVSSVMQADGSSIAMAERSSLEKTIRRHLSRMVSDSPYVVTRAMSR